jgi:hypothetical protein
VPLVGGGGAPHTTGGNPVGTGAGINYIGNHAYAYSGVITADNNETTLLDFTTGGQQYIESWIQVFASTVQADDFEINIKFDGQIIMSSEYEKSYSGNFVNGIPRKVIIPAQTRVQITATNTQGTTNADWSAIIAGRVYA